MWKMQIVAGVLAAVLVFAGLVDLSAAAKEDEELTVDQVPERVRAAILEHAEQGQIKAIERDHEDGVVMDEADYELNGAECSVTVTEGGAVIESERSISPDQLPAEVRSRLERTKPNAEIVEAEVVTATFYAIEIKVGDKHREVRVYANGLDAEDDD